MNNFDSRNRQVGGTVLGFILGLIVGLGIAVGVAVVITKTPVPFLNKLGKQEKIPDLTPGQTSDPNKPLYGNKEPAKEAAKDFAKTPDASPPAADVEKEVSATKPKPDEKAAGKVPEVKAAEAKDAKAAPPKSDAGDEKWIYYLQAGAFREQADAESTKAKLALAGFEAAIYERPSDNGPLYRVRIGPFNQVETLNRAKAKLSDNGMDVAVIRVAK